MFEVEALAAQVESLRAVLVARATGEGDDPAQYRRLRQALLTHREASPLLPSFVKACPTLGDFWDFIKAKFPTYTERRDFLRSEFAPLTEFAESKHDGAAAEAVRAALRRCSPEDVHRLWEKALERRDRDPEGAITAARTLLEAVCRFVLDDQKISYPDDADLPKIYSLAAHSLRLAPEQHQEDLFKRILGSCQAVVIGVGMLRNKLSDAHGRSTRQVRPGPRHAALAVNLAGSMATFLVETYEHHRKGGGGSV